MRILASTLALAFTFTLAACGGDDSSPTEPDPGTEPETGALSVSMSTQGPTPDPDGYAVAPQGESAQDVDVDGTAVFTDLETGSYDIEVSKLATNCQQAGSVSASVTAGDTASATVSVECAESVQDRIIFSSIRDGGEWDLYTMAHDGSDVQRLTVGADLAAMDVNDAGTRVLAVGPVSGGDDLELKIVEADGSVRQVSNDTLTQAFSTLSPDGTEIIYGGDDTTTASTSLYRRSADGSGSPTEVVADSLNTRFPDWSPDGSTVAFAQVDTASGEYDLHTAAPDGSNRTSITQDTTQSQAYPTYSPSGDRLAYFATGNSTLTVMNLGDGSTQELGHAGELPSWLPGGERLVYHRNDASSNWQLYRSNADGTDEIPLTGNSVDDAYVAVALWSSGNESN